MHLRNLFPLQPFLLPYQNAMKPSIMATAMEPMAIPAIAPALRVEAPFSDEDAMGACDRSLMVAVGEDAVVGVSKFVDVDFNVEEGELGGLDVLIEAEAELDTASLIM